MIPAVIQAVTLKPVFGSQNEFQPFEFVLEDPDFKVTKSLTDVSMCVCVGYSAFAGYCWLPLSHDCVYGIIYFFLILLFCAHLVALVYVLSPSLRVLCTCEC